MIRFFSETAKKAEKRKQEVGLCPFRTSRGFLEKKIGGDSTAVIGKKARHAAHLYKISLIRKGYPMKGERGEKAQDS